MGSALEKMTREFIDRWSGHGDEKQETQRFWLDLLQNVLHVDDALKTTLFEYRTVNNGFIDVLCPDARLLVEQKSAGIDLDKPEIRQGTPVTPVQQALRYADALPFSLKPSVLCTCNFGRFRFYDLELDPRATGSPVDEFTLEQLPDHVDTLRRIFSDDHSRLVVQQKLSEHAGVLVAELHNAMAKQYVNPDDPQSHHALATLTVRLVFALYAEDAGLFPADSFSDYVKSYDATHLRRALLDLFDVLNTDRKDRDPYLEDELNQFDYVNGGLFREHVEVPQFTEEIRQAIIHAGEHFTWRDISPVIFGSLMEETLSHDQRRKGGMHYTTVKNIHRLIDPLFLDGLKSELDGIEHDSTIGERARRNRLEKYQDKLASLRFLDPACGSGNFLTETFLQLRALENRVIGDLLHGQGYVDFGQDTDAGSLVKVRIDQFHGIEINDFAVSVAKTALWIAEQQALDDTQAIADQTIPHLPLHDSGNIVQANALQYDWNELLPGSECSYVMGNPPFVGRNKKSDEQIADMERVWGDTYDGNLDYATCWFNKTAHYLPSYSDGAFAFVATNSICQGIQVPFLFKPLRDWGWHIGFAHRTFAWDAQSTDLAHVHVVIIGMRRRQGPAMLFSYSDITGESIRSECANINGYLVEGSDVFAEKRTQKEGPLSPVLALTNFGSMPRDGGNLILNDHEAYEEAMSDSIAAKYVRRFIGSRELINAEERWCLWLKNAEPSDLRNSKFIAKRVSAVKAMREASAAAATRKMAKTAWLFAQDGQPDKQYVCIPKVFSGRREYATCAIMPPDVIASDLCFTCVDPDGLAFAIIESSMFIVWQKTVGGRLKSDCRFSNTVVWNSLPLPKLTDDMRERVISAGRGVLAARANHPGQSLADLYDPDVMPQDLRRSHEALDRVTDIAFGGVKPCTSHDERLQILFNRYAEMTQ